MKKLATDTPVHPHRARHIMHVAADPVAEIGDLVDERNLGGEKSVGSVLGQLCGFERSDNERRLDQVERAIEVFDDRNGLFIVAADDDTVWTHKVVNGRTL